MEYVSEVWKSRPLIVAFYRRDLKVRYAQTLIGILWVLVQPLAYLMVFLLAFSALVESTTESVPYLFYPVTGLIVWMYFNYCVQQSGSTLIRSQEIIRKSYFPRIILPLSKSLIGLIDLAVVLILALTMAVYYGLNPGITWLIIPVLIACAIALSIGVGLLISIFSIRYRDVQHLIPLFTHVLLFLSPIAYPSRVVMERLPSSLEWMYYLNPMAGLIDGIRWVSFGEEVDQFGVVLGVIISCFLLVLGIVFYTKNDRRISDEI